MGRRVLGGAVLWWGVRCVVVGVDGVAVLCCVLWCVMGVVAVTCCVCVVVGVDVVALLWCVLWCVLGAGEVSGGLTSPGVEQGYYTVNIGWVQSFGGVNVGTARHIAYTPDVELEAVVGGQTESFQSLGG